MATSRTPRTSGASEMLNRALLEAVPDLMTRISADGTILEFKSAKRVETPAPPAEIVGKNASDVLPPEAAARVMHYVGRALETGEVQRYHAQLPVAGEMRNREVRAVVTGEEEVVLLVRDVTGRTGAEEALRESEQNLRLLAENVGVVFWLLDPKDYQVLFVNPAFEELWGRTCESLYEDSRSWLAAVHPEDLERVSEALENQAETGEFEEEFRIIRPDGSIRWVWDRGFAVKDESGQVQHVVGIASDITERKRAEVALRSARDELELRTSELRQAVDALSDEAAERQQADEALRLQGEILQNISEAVYLIRASDGVVVYTNPSFERLFGYGHGEMVGKHVSIVNSPTDQNPEETAKEIMAALDRNGIWRGEIQNIRKNGTTFWCHANVSTFDHPEHGSVWVTYHMDITERMRADEALRESEERYRHLYIKTPVMLYSIDTDGRVVDVSDDWLEALGYERNEVIGRKSVEFLTEESRRYAETVTLPEFWKTGYARDVAYQFVRKNGEIADVLLSAVVERDPEGNILRSLAVLVDVTERKRAEQALLSAREVLEGEVERQLLRRNPYGLTFREFTVLNHLTHGKSDKQIGYELGISRLTASKHVSNILNKMNASSRTDAGVRAVREGLLD